MPTEKVNTKDSLGPVLLKRASRTTVAVYKISDFFEQEEPLKIKVRKISLDLLESVLSYTTSKVSDPGENLKDITDSINKLYSLFDVLMLANIVSYDNAGILKDELMSLMNVVEQYFNERFGYMLSLRDFLSHVEPSAPPIPSLESSKMQALMGVEMRGNDISWPKSGFLELEGQKDDRKAKILDYLEKNGPSSIRELALVIKGCSEKTIQRELSALVGRGVIKREGERRWSKYVLAQ